MGVQGLTFFLSYAIVAAVLGMFQFGYNTGVINAPIKVIQKFIKEVWKERYEDEISDGTLNLLWAVTVSMFAIGGMIGGISGGYIANKFGRKMGLLGNQILGILGGILMWTSESASSYEMLIIGRFVIGIHCGLNTILAPMYISEIAPLNLRGGIGTVNQLGVTLGLLISQVLGINSLLGTDHGWPVLLGLTIVPSVLQLVLLPLCPESPRHLLITKNREDDSRKALRKLRGSNDVEEEISEMQAEEAANQTEKAMSIVQLLRSSSLRMPLIVGVMMHLSQQFSGINAVFYYSTSIFTDSGMTETQAQSASIGVGVLMVVMTFVSIPLMDRQGRRGLHLWGLGGMFVFSIFMTISFLVQNLASGMKIVAVISTFGYVIFFAIGPGSIPWMITAELFSQGPRPAAMSIAVLVNWFSNFVVGQIFPTMKEGLGDYTFLPFTVLLALFWTFTYYKVPETKNRTFEEIASLF